MLSACKETMPAVVTSDKPAPSIEDLIPVLTVEIWPIERLIPYGRNPRKNDHAVDKMVKTIKGHGFWIPIIARSDGLIVDGHLRLKAAQRLGMTKVPVTLADRAIR